MVRLEDYIATATGKLPGRFGNAPPWTIAAQAGLIVRELLSALPEGDYEIEGDVAVHRSALVDKTAVLKGPIIIGSGAFVGPAALLRGGVWLDETCSVGPGCEIKSAFLFAGARIAHFNFVGESLIGADANVEAGAIIANRRNERSGGVMVRIDGALMDTGCGTFGAVVGDGCRIGANAVLAPGTLLRRSTVVERLALVDQERAGDEHPADVKGCRKG